MQNAVASKPLSALSPELKFLVACCQAEPAHADVDFITFFLETTPTAHHELIGLAGLHGVVPQVYKMLKRLSEEKRITVGKELYAAFKAAYMQTARSNMLMSAELLRIMKLLEHNGIEALGFKGPALAQLAYGDITLRQFGDLDILVAKADALQAISLLESDGYVPEIMLSGSKKEAFFVSVNVLGLSHPSHGVRIEVHWGLLSKNYAVSWDMRKLLSRPGQVLINGSAIAVPPQTDHLLYLCIHGSKHLYERLEWITDVDRTVRMSLPDWEELLDAAGEKGVTRMVLLSLWLCRELFALPLPETVHAEMDRDKTVEALGQRIITTQFGREATSSRSYGTFWLLWQMRERFVDRFRFTFYGLLLPKFDDFRYLALPKQLLFLYPLIRLFRLTMKYIKK